MSILLVPAQMLASWPASLLADGMLPGTPSTTDTAPPSSVRVVTTAPKAGDQIMVNTTVPTVAKAVPALAFSTSPTLAEITSCRVLAEPLLPMGTAVPDAAERTALAQALLSFHAAADPEDLTALEGFLNAYPKSAFRVALLTNLGLLYRLHGYWSQALSAWQALGPKEPTKSIPPNP